MTFNQMRHTKLWLAGEAGNWRLAQYELGGLGEGFDGVVRHHPTHKDSPVPIGVSAWCSGRRRILSRTRSSPRPRGQDPPDQTLDRRPEATAAVPDGDGA